MMSHLEAEIGASGFAGKEFTAGDRVFKVAMADDFEYTDPVDKSVARKQVP